MYGVRSYTAFGVCIANRVTVNSGLGFFSLITDLMARGVSVSFSAIQPKGVITLSAHVAV